jgi:ParB/RepB/Spo0J family partition protein
MNTIVEPAFGIIPMHLVRISKDNYRKRFDEAALAELAKSIKQVGVMQPVLVRPLPDTDDAVDCVEIVAGERRFRAAKMAGLETIPAIVRDLSDVEAAELRLVENLQREDVHPIEEAEGYEHMMQQHNYTADQLAEKVGKSRSYIYGRLKFCALTPAVRTAFYEGKLTASTALLVARIPVPMLQEQATREITNWNGNEPMSYRAAVRHVQARYMLELASAPFAITDLKLVPAAGSCQACPKRTGNQPELFSDIQNADVCTDPDCFEGKKKAHHDLVFHAAKKKGIPVYDQSDKDRPGHYGDENFVTGDQGLWRFDRMVDGAQNKSIDDALPIDQRPQPSSYIRDENDGEMIPVYEKTAIQEALEKAGLRMTLEQHNKMIQDKLSGAGRPEGGGAGPSQKEIERQAQLAEMQRRVDTEDSVRLAIYREVRDYAGAGTGSAMLRVLVKLLLNDFALPDDVLGEFYKFDTSSDEAIAKHVDKASTSIEELELILMDMLIGEALTVTSWELDHEDPEDNGKYRALLDLAQIAGVDVESIREELSTNPEESESADAADDHELAIGDCVRVKDDAKGPTGKKRKVAGKEGTMAGIVGEHYSVKFRPKAHEMVTNLERAELEKLPAVAEEDEVGGGSRAPIEADGSTQDAPAKTTKTKKKATPKANPKNPAAAAWPFPTGSRP